MNKNNPWVKVSKVTRSRRGPLPKILWFLIPLVLLLLLPGLILGRKGIAIPPLSASDIKTLSISDGQTLRFLTKKDFSELSDLVSDLGKVKTRPTLAPMDPGKEELTFVIQTFKDPKELRLIFTPKILSSSQGLMAPLEHRYENAEALLARARNILASPETPLEEIPEPIEPSVPRPEDVLKPPKLTKPSGNP